MQEEKQGKQPENIKRSHIAQANVEAILEALKAQQRPQHPFQEKAQQASRKVTVVVMTGTWNADALPYFLSDTKGAFPRMRNF